VRAKKVKQPPRLIRYLLSADRRLQRLSLKKMSAKTSRPGAATKSPARVRGRKNQKTIEPSGEMPLEPRALVAVAVLLVLGVALIVARQSSRSADTRIADAQPASGSTMAARSHPDLTRTSQASKTDAKKPASPAKSHAPEAPKTMPLVTAGLGPGDEPASADAATPTPMAVKPAGTTDAGAVTITGCLEHDDQSYWLTDTAGADAPTSRSWKTGFLKKRSSRIELVDGAHALRLSNYVGQRIAATGTLLNHEMQTQSMYRVATSCN
jgi:hypothetical protein